MFKATGTSATSSSNGHSEADHSSHSHTPSPPISSSKSIDNAKVNNQAISASNSNNSNESNQTDSVASLKNLAGFYAAAAAANVPHHLNAASAFMAPSDFHLRGSNQSSSSENQLFRQLDYSHHHPFSHNPFDPHHHHQLSFNSVQHNAASPYYSNQNASSFSSRHYAGQQLMSSSNNHLGIQTSSEQDNHGNHHPNQLGFMNHNNGSNINGPPSSSSSSSTSVSTSTSPPITSNGTSSPTPTPAVVAAMYQSALNATVSDPFQVAKVAGVNPSSYSYNNHLHHSMFPIGTLNVSHIGAPFSANPLNASNQANEYHNSVGNSKYYQNEFLNEYEKK